MKNLNSQYQPVKVYSPESILRDFRLLISSIWSDLKAGRELSWRLFIRDLSAQYRQTYFGYVWAFLPPLVASFTFIFLNSQGIVQIESSGLPYAAFAMIGTLLWQVFVDAFASPSFALVSARPVIAKINFPRESILFSGMYMVVFNFFVRLVLLIGVMMYWGISPGVSFAFFPVAMLGLALVGFTFGLIIAPLGALYGDVPRAIPLITQFWMLLTPVIYPARTEGLASILSVWNPVAPLLISAREALTAQPLTQMPASLVVILLSFCVCVIGLISFRVAMPHVIARAGG